MNTPKCSATNGDNILSDHRLKQQQRRCRSLGPGTSRTAFTVFPLNELETMAPCSLDEMPTVTGSAVAFSKNLISRISTRFRPKKSPVPGRVPFAPERKNFFSRPLGMKLPKELEISLRYLQEVIRNGQRNMYYRSVNAFVDALIPYLKRYANEYDKQGTDSIRDALQVLLNWTDTQVVEHLGNFPSSSDPKLALDTSPAAGVEKLALLEKALNQKKVEPDAESQNDAASSQCSDSGVEFELSGSNISVDDHNDTLTDLMNQLQLRKIQRFEPSFPHVVPDSDDDDNDVHVDEEHEERAEQHGSRTCEEEVEQRPDGRRIRMKKTRTVNMSQSRKSVTIRTHGNGQDDVTKRFQDGANDFNDDSHFEHNDMFAGRYPFSKMRGEQTPNMGSDNDSFKFDGEEESPFSPDLATKTKTIRHESATLQSVARQTKRNGKILADNAAHKLDTADLNAKQIDTYDRDKLVDRRGDGSYEESTIIRNGLPGIDDTYLSSPLAPIKRNAVEIIKTVGDNNVEGKDNFFHATSLASYITLNDNLRLFEEQHHKKVTYTFGTSGISSTSSPTQTFINLQQLLQVSENDKIVLPTIYVDDSEDADSRKNASFSKPLLQITDKPSILESLDVSEYLVLRAKDGHSKPTEVRGGPKDALIVYATQPIGTLLYQEAFLATYRGFVTSAELIQKLVRRYLFMNASNKLNEIKAGRQTFSVLVRVVDELCSTELTRELIHMVTSFVYRLIRDGNYDFARLLRKRLMERIEEKSPLNNAEIIQHSTDSTVYVKPSMLFHCQSLALAKQITYLDSELFHKIEPAEMLWWAKDQDPKKSPNVVAFTEHFNRISYWVRTNVLASNEQREREKYFVKFIKVMKQLRKMGNLSSYLAILSALDSGPVRRLDWSKSLREQLEDHTDIIDSKMSFKNYRAVLAEIQPPCLPYIGLILQDLTFVDVGNQDYVSPAMCNNRTNLLNYGKRWQQFAILDNVRRFKSWTYDIQRDEKVQRLFNGFKNCLGEEETWARSLEIKPRKTSTNRS